MLTIRLWLIFYLTPAYLAFSFITKHGHCSAPNYPHVYLRDNKPWDERLEPTTIGLDRRSLLRVLSSLVISLLPISPSPVGAAMNRNNQRFDFSSLSVMKVKNRDDMIPVNVPEVKQQEIVDGFLLGKGLDIETWMLKLLPIKSNVFQTIQRDIAAVSILREESSAVSETMWKTLSYKLTLTLQYLDNQRFKLQPVFNLDDTTELEIAKAERGEKLLENLRERLVALNSSILDHNKTSTLLDQQAALRALSEVGEMLVESYPFNVPDQGKFSYLPRLLGRAKVTFTWARPLMNTPDGKSQIPLLDPTSTTTSLLTYKEQILGNVTILVDGFIAPITAGNFVDLSIRGFYTDLPVKFMRKRLGVNPSLTLPGADSSNLVVYDIADTLDKIKAMDDSSSGVDKDSWVISDMPIFGSFGEGFYDPLTAKPRRIPFEVVQYDRGSGKTTLSYSSAALDSPNQMFTQVSSDKGRWWSGISSSGDMPSSTRDSQNSIVLNFNIPGLVTMNHPDRNLNGGSSEFFVLHERDRIDERTRLLNGSYAPFGYVLDGLDILQSLQPGDVIRSTHVDEWGKLNLVKIRTLSLTQGIS